MPADAMGARGDHAADAPMDLPPTPVSADSHHAIAELRTQTSHPAPDQLA